MKTWICKACGYTHHGDEAPSLCPKCGASQSEFELRSKTKGCSLGCALLVAVALGVIIAASVYACITSRTVDNSVVKTVDVYKYQGKWYEIARYDHRFERGMEQCIATYSLQKDGTIKVTNQGKKDGKWKTSEGKAKLTDEPGVLRVSFWGPFYSDYRIMVLAPDYSYALVGGSNDDYLWILSRTPELKKETRDMLLNEAQRRGYDTDKLIWEKHTAVYKSVKSNLQQAHRNNL